jgi:hypothetical protein
MLLLLLLLLLPSQLAAALLGVCCWWHADAGHLPRSALPLKQKPNPLTNSNPTTVPTL